MKIVIQDSKGCKLVTLKFDQLDVNINKGRLVIVRSISTKHNFLTGVAIKKTIYGDSYIEIKANSSTLKKNQIPLLIKDLFLELHN